MCGERTQIHDRIPLKRLYNELIHVITGHKLLYSQKEHARIVVVCYHLNQAHFSNYFVYYYFIVETNRCPFDFAALACPFNLCAFAIQTNLIQ